MAEERNRKRKRNRDDFLNILKTYPRFLDGGVGVGCAVSANTDITKKAFERCCPVFFNVDNVQCYKQHEDPVCCWIVDYVPIEELPGDGDSLKTLVDTILSQVPVNCEAINRGLVENGKIKVFYAVYCNCTAPIFEQLTTRSPLLSIGQSLQNLKLQDIEDQINKMD